MKRFLLLLAMLLSGPVYAQAIGTVGMPAPLRGPAQYYTGSDGLLHAVVGDNLGHISINCSNCGGGGSGSNAAASATGSAVPAYADYAGYLGADGNLHGWLGDNLGHPYVIGTGTFSVQNTAATPAGSNIIGKVGIDQTTPGTTNSVSPSVKTSGGSFVATAGDANGSLVPSIAGTANRIITKTSVAASTSTSVCPVVTNPLAVEIEVQTGTIGLGLNGQALSSAAYGTATTNPDIVIGSANTLYIPPVPVSNSITAYTATAQVVICIQTTRP